MSAQSITTAAVRGTTQSRLLERIDNGHTVIHGSGYLFEMERRGLLQAGGYVPEVVLEHPDAVEMLTRELVNCGSDVILAFTYYGHREKMRLIGKESLLEPLNREAMRIARRVQADFPNALLAGNTCNSNIFDPEDTITQRHIRDMMTEQVGWAVEGGAEFIVAETFPFMEEARIAVEVCKGFNMPVVVGMAIHRDGMTRDGFSVGEACRILYEEAGADVVGVNCHRGPATMLPLLEEAIAAGVPANRVAGWAVGYRTTPEQPTFGALTDPGQPRPEMLPAGMPFPTGLDVFTATRWEFWDYGERTQALGVRYVGTCCGAGPHHVRAIAEAIGRTPPASRYSADMSKHYALGDQGAAREVDRKYRQRL